MCVFCEIVAGTSPASVVYEDDKILAFMTLRPINHGQFMVIPKAHIDHFTDMDDDLSAHIIITAQRLGRAMKQAFSAERVGFVVHGYGVPHAHLNVVNQQDPLNIISDKFLVPNGRPIEVSETQIPIFDYDTLDEHAGRIRKLL